MDLKTDAMEEVIESSSSMEIETQAKTKVVDNVELMTEILLLLPPKSIFTSMSVCKTWYNVVAHPYFIKTYTARRRRRAAAGVAHLVAFFTKIDIRIGECCPSLDSHVFNIAANDIDLPVGYFINSSEGLILCSQHPEQLLINQDNGYYVVNPITMRSVGLPPHPPPPMCGYRRSFASTGIMWRETTELVADYIVVRAFIFKDKYYYHYVQYIQTYCSRRREWDTSVLVATGFFYGLLNRPPVVANGVFHWFASILGGVRDGIALYDPDRHGNHLQLIQLPLFLENTAEYTVTRSMDDHLWLGVGCRGTMKIYTLIKCEDGSYKQQTTISCERWVMKHYIVMDHIDMGIKNLRFEALIPLNPLLAVLRSNEMVFLCDLEKKAIQRVEYNGRFCQSNRYQFEPYFEPSLLSCYAL